MSLCVELLHLGLVAALTLQAGPPDPVLKLADRLLVDGQVDRAVIEYRRYLYFNRDRDDAHLSYAFSQIALAARAKGHLEDAASTYRAAIEGENRTEVKDELRFELALTEMLRGRFDLADFALLRVETFTTSGPAKARASFLLGVSSLYQANWSAAWSAFGRYAEAGEADPLVVAALRELKSDKPRLKSATKARLLSTLVPGLGQVYAGEWGNGLNAFLLSSGGALLVARNVAAGRWVDASLDFVNVFVRFYGGNRRGAARLATSANARAGRNAVVALERAIHPKRLP